MNVTTAWFCLTCSTWPAACRWCKSYAANWCPKRSAAHRMLACGASKTAYSRCGGHWPVVAISGLTSPPCCKKQASRPKPNRLIWPGRAP